MPRPSPSSSDCSLPTADRALPEGPGHFVYVLRCGDGSLYTGYTTDVGRRLTAHRNGKGARYTRSRQPLTLLAWWACEGKQAAMREEWSFKQLPRSEKLARLRTGAERHAAKGAGGVYCL